MPRPASSAPHKRLPKQPTHLSIPALGLTSVYWGSDEVRVHVACRAMQGWLIRRGWRCFFKSQQVLSPKPPYPDPLQRPARFPPQRVPSGGGAAGTSDGSKRRRHVKTIVNVWTCHGARAWLRAPGALQPLPPVAAPALWSVAAGPEQNPSKSGTFCPRLCIPASPRPPRCRGTLPPYRSKGWCLWNMQFEAFVHTFLLGHTLWAKPQVRMLVERLCKRLGALEDTGRSTASVGVSTSWRGIYIYTCSDASVSVSSSDVSWKNLEETGSSRGHWVLYRLCRSLHFLERYIYMLRCQWVGGAEGMSTGSI